MDQFEVREMISEKGTVVKMINNFKFNNQKELTSYKERWHYIGTIKICKSYLKVDKNY